MQTRAQERVCVSLLGSFELKVDDQIIRLPTRKTEALFAYLVLHPSLQSREKLAALFWGDTSDELARRSLRTALSALRKELGEELFITDRETVQLNPRLPLWVDVLEIENQASDSAVDLDLYRGDLLQDSYDEWVLEEREHYRNRFVRALSEQADRQRAASAYQRVIEIAQKTISIDPANERAYQHLIFCYSALGNRSAAIKSYEDCAVQLQERLGVEPSKETCALYEHAKKTSRVPASLMQSNLPIPLTSFIGREHELNTLNEIFGKTRLLTLTGVGGCGKTRLSIQFAGQLVDQYADGVWWVELASIQDEKLVEQTVKKTLGVSENPSDSAEESILKFLRPKQLLLVMDNCEHVITACARLAEHLLSQCPEIKILATSREALSIQGEIAWLVPSLSLPPIDHDQNLLNWESPRLFFERARSYRPDLQLTEANAHSVMRICRALEGIPLAMELAAARVKTLSLEQLASRLDDRLSLLTTGSRTAQPRQQTLRAAIDWSYELLSDPEKIALQRFSILAGHWTLAAAEAIASLDEISPEPPLDLITHLLDKSLLVADMHDGEMRYRMLEIIRQYAFEKLQRADEVQKVQDQHTRYFLEQAQRARPLWFTPAHAKLMNEFDEDYPNLQVALAWGLENPKRSSNWENGVKLAIDMGPLWTFLGEYREGVRWLKKAMDQANGMLTESAPGSEQGRGLRILKAKAMYEYGFIIWFQSQYIKSREIFMEASDLFRQTEDHTGLAYSNMFLAHSTWILGERETADEMWKQSLGHFTKIDDLWGAAMVHSFLGRAAREANRFEQAKVEYNKCLELFSAVGDGWGLGIGYSHLGMIAFQEGDAAQARTLFEQRLTLSREHGFRQSVAYSILLLGIAAWKLGKPEEVKHHMLEGLTHFYRLGNYVTFTDGLAGLAWAEAELGNAARAAYLLGALEKADQAYGTRTTFEDVYFNKPILNDLQSRESIQHWNGEIEKGRNATLDEIAKEITDHVI